MTDRKELTAQEDYWLDGIQYFKSGTRLFNLVYVLLVIQIVLGCLSCLLVCAFTVAGSSMFVSFITALIDALNNIKIQP